jgi:hypothetical protein
MPRCQLDTFDRNAASPDISAVEPWTSRHSSIADEPGSDLNVKPQKTAERVLAKHQPAGARIGVDCHTTICQPFVPLTHTLV